MKYLLALLVGALFLTGCKSTYDITLSNGRQFTGVSKPVLSKKTGKYHFKTIDGREGAVYPDNVRVIEPHREPYEFRPSAPKK